MHKSVLSLLSTGILVGMIGTANAWETSNPFEGVTYSKLRGSDVHPILSWNKSPLAVDVMEIDLGANGISFKTTPSNGSKAGDTTRQTTKDFMIASGTEIAINTNFYSTDFSPYSETDNIGLMYSDGTLVSAFGTGWPAINISSSNQVELVKTYYSNQYNYFNAFAGSDVIVENGSLTGNGKIYHATEYHPRSSVGYNADENKLILMTVDGRRTSSLGVTNNQLGKLMQNFGATFAVNLDGGGSTQMTMNDGTAHYVNTPSDANPYRKVGGNLGVNAIIDNTYREIANFNHNNAHEFYRKPSYSGSNKNVSASSSFGVTSSEAASGDGSMKINIIESTASQDWRCRFLSGSGTSSNNVALQTDGYIGVWAKTADADQEIALALDDGAAMELSIKFDVIADNKWHYYEWNLDDASQWDAFAGSTANGKIDNATFTLDSIFLYGKNNSTIYLDNVVHDIDESMMPIPEPATLGLMAIGGIALLRRRR
ncbi:phosphodiester glycosidase family protein [Planctomycetota bacterium]|nr:phosphodiester glycosidase family protein [Planctomycetota bacterium]